MAGGLVIHDSGTSPFTAEITSVPEPAPSLRVALTGTNTVLIAWPAPSTGFGLQQNAALDTTNWVSVTSAVNVVGSEKQVIIAAPVGQKFYRLTNP